MWKMLWLYHEFHETRHSVTLIVLVNSHQRWKQTRFCVLLLRLTRHLKKVIHTKMAKCRFLVLSLFYSPFDPFFFICIHITLQWICIHSWQPQHIAKMWATCMLGLLIHDLQSKFIYLFPTAIIVCC